MGGNARIRYDYYLFEVTSVNQLDVDITVVILNYLATMDVFGNLRIYELISFPYEYYHGFSSYVKLGTTG
jgi:hypothetical protein